MLSALSAQFESKTALKIKSLLGNKKKILDEGENAKYEEIYIVTYTSEKESQSS